MKNYLFSSNGLFLIILKVIAISLICNKHLYDCAIVNEKLFGSVDCVPYAYGDFNADKLVDIYCVAQPGN